MADFWTALQHRRSRQPGAPVVTYINGTTTERTELSAVTLENSAAKIANALRDEYDLDAGATVGLALPLHWQRATWCAGAWTAGCAIAFDPADPDDVDLMVVAEDAASAGNATTVAVSLHPFGLPISRELPPDVMDVTLAVRTQPDAYLYDVPNGNSPAIRHSEALRSQEQVWELANELAARWSVEPEGRLLVTEGIAIEEAWLACLAVPLAANCSVVLLHGVDAGKGLLDAERITATSAPSL